ncbi:MAG: alpha-glycosidase [Firmicutes bacterium]|nr:alpha-glycosidase [Bacillota bacterium]
MPPNEVKAMLKEAIHHQPFPPYLYGLDERKIAVRLRAKKGDLQECLFFYGDRYAPVNPVPMHQRPMTKVASDLLFDYFEVELSVEYTRLCYCFWLSDGVESCYYYGNNFYSTLPEDRNQYFILPFLRREEIYRPPAWAEEAVIYQIFPDSFATGRQEFIPDPKVFPNHTGGVSQAQYGGDLPGIIANLPYLADLGINCLYLTPIFTATSYHKYDPADYFTIDPCFGDAETLKELVRKAHERGIKVILDGVFNHCGPYFFAFQDVLTRGEKSPYRNWFYRLNFPVAYGDPPNYEAFAYVKTMPKLNTGDPAVRQYLIDVGTYWIKEADIDGWRLDVANEVDHYFWQSFRRAVKAVKPEAFLIGEIWGDAEPWLRGDEFDSTMNYRFAGLCREFFAEKTIGVSEFDARFHQLLMRYMRPITNLQMNLLDSHDVPRFLSWCRGDLRRYQLAVLFQMTAPGIPSIFYGDEAGLTGFTEKDYRQPMRWDRVDSPLTDYYRRVIGLRRRLSALQNGTYRRFLLDEAKNVYGFIRENSTEKVYVLLNNSGETQTVRFPAATGKKMTDLLHDREYLPDGSVVQIKLPPVSGAVLL